MKVRLAAALATVLSLVLAAPAMAVDNDNGEGLLGELNDRIITFFSLGVVVFFVIVVCLGSYIQARLERRKDARKAAELRQRIGW
jgi:heme/copper-type cytochrome/quinol oxidase subunit 2